MAVNVELSTDFDGLAAIDHLQAADDLMTAGQLTAAQVAAARWLIASLKVKFKITRRAKGHNEYDKGKACPSFRMQGDVLGAI